MSVCRSVGWKKSVRNCIWDMDFGGDVKINQLCSFFFFLYIQYVNLFNLFIVKNIIFYFCVTR